MFDCCWGERKKERIGIEMIVWIQKSSIGPGCWVTWRLCWVALFVYWIHWKDHVRVHFAWPCNGTKHNHRNQKWRRYLLPDRRRWWWQHSRIVEPNHWHTAAFQVKKANNIQMFFYILIGCVCFCHLVEVFVVLPLSLSLWVYCLHLDCAIDVTRDRLFGASPRSKTTWMTGAKL